MPLLLASEQITQTFQVFEMNKAYRIEIFVLPIKILCSSFTDKGTTLHYLNTFCKSKAVPMHPMLALGGREV